MRVVIDIPDDDFVSIRCEGLYYIGHDKLAESVTNAFQNSLVLPEGHGDLIDRDELKSAMPTPIEDEYKTAYRIIDNAHAVIPADKGE